MNAKGKTDATAGKQKRTAKGAKSVEAVAQAQSLNSFGEFPSIQVFRAGPGSAHLRDEDWNFGGLWMESHQTNEDRASLTAACWYEYARESQYVREAMWGFLSQAATAAFLSEGSQEAMPPRLLATEPDIASPTDSLRAAARRSIIQQIAIAVEHEVQSIEARGGIGAPRLRKLAQHLIDDRPWLLIPKEDRDLAIRSAFANRFDVPESAEGMSFFRAKPAFERVNWRDIPPLEPSEGDVSAGKELDRREVTQDNSLEPRRSAGDEVLPALIRWGDFTNAEIITDFGKWVERARPCKWKEVAKGSGRGKTSWFIAALKELAAMRLMHAKPPEKGRQLFADAYLARHSKGRRGEVDESNFRRLARKCVKTFEFLFPYGQKPLHQSTWTERHRRG